MQKLSSTGIVITQWRDPETTAVCLSHVASLTPQPRMIVVVDNESDNEILVTQAGRVSRRPFSRLADKHRTCQRC